VVRIAKVQHSRISIDVDNVIPRIDRVVVLRGELANVRHELRFGDDVPLIVAEYAIIRDIAGVSRLIAPVANLRPRFMGSDYFLLGRSELRLV
jgi:hypothetical protein